MCVCLYIYRMSNALNLKILCKQHRMSEGNKRVNIYKSPYRAWEEKSITLQHWLNLIVITAVAFDHFFLFFSRLLLAHFFFHFISFDGKRASTKKCANNFHSAVSNFFFFFLPLFACLIHLHYLCLSICLSLFWFAMHALTIAIVLIYVRKS